MVRITQRYDSSLCTYCTSVSPGVLRESNYTLICAVEEAHTNVGVAQIVLPNEL